LPFKVCPLDRKGKKRAYVRKALGTPWGCSGLRFLGNVQKTLGGGKLGG